MSLKSFGKAFATLAVSMLICGNAYGAIESDRAVMLSPAKDGAYVVKMLGLTNNKKIVLLNGARKTIHDGIVIRASKIENGKIIIPHGSDVIEEKDLLYLIRTGINGAQNYHDSNCMLFRRLPDFRTVIREKLAACAES
jgi:hypothetical protein